jgi:hypothetical protein
MRMSIALPIAAALAAAAIGLSSPAAGTTLKEALQLCNKHGGCTVNAKPNVGANIVYNRNEIYCPFGGGQCVCLLCGPLAKGATVASVLSQSATGAAPTPQAPGSTGPKVGATPAVKPAGQR